MAGVRASMYREASVAVVVPCYNEEAKLPSVLDTIPDVVDRVYVVDDGSTDRSFDIAVECSQRDPRVVPIRHGVNRGVGAAIGTGYERARDDAIDIAVVMAGDGQMDPCELPALV